MKSHCFIPTACSLSTGCCGGSVAKSRPILCNPTDCSTPGFRVLHYLPEFAQTYVRWIGAAIQPSHPLLPSSPFALNLSSDTGKDWSTDYPPKNCGIALFWMRGQSLTATQERSLRAPANSSCVNRTKRWLEMPNCTSFDQGMTLQYLVLERDTGTEGRVAFCKDIVTLTSRHSLWTLVSVVGGDGGGKC